MKVVQLCFFMLSGVIPLSSIAQMNNYVHSSTLTASFSSVAEVPAFLKQGDTVRILTHTPSSSARYAGTAAHTNGDEWCVSPSVRPYKYEAYKWPETIDMDNLRLSLVDPENLGITTGTAPRICFDYQPGGDAFGYKTNWEFVGNGMTATYRVSQIYRAGSATINTNVKVISGRSEYSSEEIINKIKNLQHYFQPVNITLTTNVKNWCSASVGPGRDILLDHGELSASEVNNHQVSSPIQLSCTGEGAYFQLKWFEGQTAGTKKIIDIKTGLQTELSIEGIPEDGKVFVPVNTLVRLDVKSALKTSNINIEPGSFSASQILVIEIT
ncbi:hypothetical protein K7P98_001374 [Salmonella enterica]|uniref:hypothetical protein n=1 Tax=Escherichia TaxID=561 RepID=UPI000B7D3863|nr:MULTISPECIES: hypothetical protein [Escherichia]EDX8870369.1 hypothetical protein [Salmonella enterica subsp. enterica serovar Anatum]EGU3225172.1 hypothetical protein [Salmonella enterica]EGX8509112.1 hypothetical protein [Salmonella enterica subsp. enterica serovar Typhimurium]EFB2393947.1 hypothetical protein [Escherichia coli]EGU4852955.1 hypothetical protein [Salmonella enterica]